MCSVQLTSDISHEPDWRVSMHMVDLMDYDDDGRDYKL